ncbi:GRP family sugar transporter [Niallia sp. 01092]|uniref:GRP family sugar transporter n=1 Tax=unclassified Niallia TaxID=2837522 RepID=UPI003FD02B75
MDLFLAILPAIFWGSIVLLNVKIGGGAYSQTLGTTIGALLFSTIIYLFAQPQLNTTIFIVGVISGIFWAFGQSNQFKSIEYIGVSKTMPISTGLQIVSTTLFGVLIFHEWTTLKTILFGVIAIICILSGIILTSYDKNRSKEENTTFKKGVITLLFSTVGYLGYAVIARFFEVDGWSALFPQAIGMFIGGFIITYKHKPYNKYAIFNIFPGLFWAAGNMFLFISQPKVGVAISFSLSQTGVVISTLGGIFLLKEKKTKRQLVFIGIGIIFIIIGVVCLGLAKR